LEQIGAFYYEIKGSIGQAEKNCNVLQYLMLESKPVGYRNMNKAFVFIFISNFQVLKHQWIFCFLQVMEN
jgi:hypothetical protein